MRSTRTSRALWGAEIAGSVVVALLGLATVIGPAALLTAPVALAATSPWVVRNVRRWIRAIPAPSGEQLDGVLRALAASGPGVIPFPAVPAPQPDSDEQLCRAWCASREALSSVDPGAEFICLVEARGRYLDELERRNPAGFSAWLASGAAAGEDPLPYLGLTPVDHAAIDWDDLLEGHG